MAADRFNRVRIGSIYVTRDGGSSSTPCKLSISDLSLLQMDKTGNVEPTANGSPFIQLVDVHGVELLITVTKLKQAVFEDLKAAFNALNNAGDPVEVEITGRTGNFTKNFFVHPKNPLSAGSFVNDNILRVEIRLVSE